MGSKKSGFERFQDSLDYIYEYVDAGLANHLITQLIDQNVETIGKGLSLSGSNYWILGTEGQHRAVRALLLCQRTYLCAPWANKDFVFVSDIPPGSTITKKACQRMSEDQVKKAIGAYLPVQNASKSNLVSVALKHKDGEKGFKICWETFNRKSNFVKQITCFSVIPWWLFMAGFVSIRWLTKINLTPYTVNDSLGRGALIQAGQDHKILEGNLINFHMVGHEDMCHWAVSMGGGWAVGVNNTAGWRKFDTKFRNNGGGVYGEFEINSMRAVLADKYSVGSEKNPIRLGCEVRSIDPGTVAGYL